MTPKSPIGVIDSGSGGLSIWKEIVSLLPHEHTIYIGDHKYIPYSSKSTTVIRHRVKKMIQLLLSKQVKLIVIACNTATVAGIDWYRNEFSSIPIIGVVPVIKTAAQMTTTKTIAVLSTVYTAKSSYQQSLIAKFANDCKVLSLGNAQLVKKIESHHDNNKEIGLELARVLKPVQQSNADVLVLGCTHFPFIKDRIATLVGKHVHILDSGAAVARHVQRVLIHNALVNTTLDPTHLFYTTHSHYKQIEAVMSKLLKRPIVVLPASIT